MHRVRPHALEGLRRSDGTIDWSPWYLTEEEDMGQSGEQGQIIDVLQSSLQVLAGQRGWSSVLVASDNFFAWVDGEPYVQVSPDVYLLDNPPGPDEPMPGRWEVWRPEHSVPRFVVEIVSARWKKDYEINPARYDHLGVSELVLADRDAFVRTSQQGMRSGVAAEQSGRVRGGRGLVSEPASAAGHSRAAGHSIGRDTIAIDRVPLSVYRRSAADRLELAYAGNGPAFCAELDAYLCFKQSSPGRPRVRISRDPAGNDIVPTLIESRTAAEERASAAEERASAAEERASAAEERASAAEEQAAEARREAAAQAAEIAALRNRLRDPQES
ncbi:MAG: Uma2 family endonuclease [Proteobacteria bacterium]|nr:Uma2 family endonuclease [Pseudomonadota bacterium]